MSDIIKILEERVKQLEEALKPFALLAVAIVNSHPEGNPSDLDIATLQFDFIKPIRNGRGRSLTNAAFLNAYEVLTRPISNTQTTTSNDSGGM